MVWGQPWWYWPIAAGVLIWVVYIFASWTSRKK